PSPHALRQICHHRPKKIASSRPAKSPNGVSRDDASKEVTTPTDAAVARPGAGPGFHPETSCRRVTTLKGRPQQGERRLAAPPPFHQNESGEGFRPECRHPTARVRHLKPAPSLRPPQPRDATVAAPQSPLPKLHLPLPS